MIKIKINNRIQEVKKGTTPLDLLKPEDKKKYFLCNVNNRLRELTYPLERDATIEYLKLDHSEAGKAYEASLRYVIAMAFHNLYPEVNIRFSYNVSRSIFCQILTPGVVFDNAMFQNISQEIERLINLDLKIERYLTAIPDAIELYKKFNFLDKIDILKYRPEQKVHLYSCGDYINYMHSYMVPSTGYLHNYKLRLYNPGMIIQYPRYELGGEIPPFEDAPTYGKTLKRAYEWANRIEAQTIYQINQKIENNEIIDFVQVCEAKHSNMLAEIGMKIKEDIENIRLIAIAGPSSSGKTTFSNRLRIELMSLGIKPVMISIDDYYLNREDILPDENGDVDLEHINTLDLDLFNQHMLALINGEEVEMPHFDFKIGRRVPGKKVRVHKDSPIIIEGIHALNEALTSLIPKHQKFKIFISPQIQINIDNYTPMSITDLRLIRRIVRDKHFRNTPARNTIAMWPSVRRGEFRWIYPHQEGADYVFNSELTYELCVLKKYALETLKEIKTDDEYYITANRLIKFLKYFKTLDDDIIPNNSILREFIGGSIF